MALFKCGGGKFSTVDVPSTAYKFPRNTDYTINVTSKYGIIVRATYNDYAASTSANYAPLQLLSGATEISRHSYVDDTAATYKCSYEIIYVEFTAASITVRAAGGNDNISCAVVELS